MSGCLLCCARWLVAVLVAVCSVVLGLSWALWPQTCCEHLTLRPSESTSPTGCPSGIGEDVGRDMEDEGFTVVPNALGPESIARLLEYQESLPWANYFSGYRMPDFNAIVQLAPDLWPALENVIRRIQDGSSIRVAEPDGSTNKSFRSLEFLIANGSDPEHSVGHVWHQDFEAYYFSQQSFHYLNMYLVLEKPEPLEAGLRLVPRSTMRTRAPKLHSETLDNAATAWLQEPGKPEILRTHKTYDKFYAQDFSLDDISCTPRLVPGDLLVLRGDTPHRTQVPIRSYRTTLSVRVSNITFNVNSMFEGGLIKYSRMYHMKESFIITALKTEFGAQFVQRHLQDWQRSPKFLQRRAFVLGMKVQAGYWGRYALSKVRCATGRLLGENECFMWYY